MNALVDFFALRPVFTHYGLKLVWYVYLLNVIIQTYTALHGIVEVLAQRGVSWEAWWPNFIPLILQNLCSSCSFASSLRWPPSFSPVHGGSDGARRQARRRRSRPVGSPWPNRCVRSAISSRTAP